MQTYELDIFADYYQFYIQYDDRDPIWLVLALVSYVVLCLLLYWGNKKLFFVPYKKGQNSSNDTCNALQSAIDSFLPLLSHRSVAVNRG